MSRPFRARVLAAVLCIAAAGCQDYNFNPVGHCLLQPGNQRFTLSNVSSADVLFVVDDSGSMAGEQERLADAFTDFVENLNSTNVGRAASGLLPLDFHVAVTTSSIFANRQDSGAVPMCSTACAPGKLACCLGNQPVYAPRTCTPGVAGQCTVAHTACRNTCTGFKGENKCCSDGSGTTPADDFPLEAINSVGGQVVECKLAGVPCGPLKTHYDWSDSQCTPSTRGVSLDGLSFPDGAFVGSTSVAAVDANPRVLHFDKRLYLSSQKRNAQGFSMDQLKRFFEQNVRVGTCGSMQEQGLQASRRAIEDALAGKQLDTYAYDWAAGLTSGASSAATRVFSAPGGIPTLTTPAVWPTPNSKLVVVYVGDEDDCSSPKDPSAGVVLLSTDGAGADACTRDASEAAPLGGKEYAVASFVSYLTGLGRPVGAAFVVSATSSGTDVWNPAICCDTPCVSGIQQAHLSDPGYPTSPYANLCTVPGDPSTCVCAFDICGGQAPGTRFVETAKQLKAKGADVVVGSVCGDFKPLLRQVAEIVKPPQTLTLPTVPAESGISLLRIASADGSTRKVCGRPLAPRRPVAYTMAEAQATGADWWFVPSADPAPPYDPDPASTLAPIAVAQKYVYINSRGTCIANPGETYSLDYLGIVPSPKDPPAGQPVDLSTGGCNLATGAADCQAKLGGRVQDWTCSELPGVVVNGGPWGTCVCRSGG